MRQIIPFYLILFHQNLGNSVFGLSNGRFNVSLLLQILLLMAVFLLLDKHFSYIRLIILALLGLAVGLWSASPENFKLIGGVYLIFFVTYYVISLNGFKIIKNHLTYIVIASMILSVFQIAGVSEFVHSWNSQYINETAGSFFREIKIVDVTTIGHSGNYFNSDYFDSRQVRPNGIFHSSAVISFGYVAYIAYVLAGFYRSKLHFWLIPWLVVFSGSKLVLLATVLMIFLAMAYRKVSIRIFLIILLSGLGSVAIHLLLFGTLLAELFNFDILSLSFKLRFHTYFGLNFDEFLAALNFSAFIPYIGLLIGTGFVTYLAIRQLANRGISYVHYVLVIGFISSIITTPHPGNLLFGLFFLPAFFSIKQSRYSATVTREVELLRS